ncbi:putative reverse transcriptase domain-containing protein [Tanacetum coccineum]
MKVGRDEKRLFLDFDGMICVALRLIKCVVDALRRKWREKYSRNAAWTWTNKWKRGQMMYGVRGMILTALSEAFKQENVPLVGSEMDEAHASRLSIKGLRVYCNNLRYLNEVGRFTMDFITKLPRSKSGHDTIWVIVDRLTKSAHFLAIREDYSTEKLAKIYIDEIVARHRRVPVSINSDRDGRFTSLLLETVQKALGTRLDMSTAYHPQKDGQSKHMIQTLEDMLRDGVVCALFEALYGRKCRSPVLWAEIGESSLIGPELVQEMTDKVVLIKEKLKAARDRQKSYADNRRKPLEFEVGDRILERIGPVAYRLRLPEELSGVHDTFHVSNLKKCLADASLHVPLDEIKVDKTLRFVEEPVEIMDREVKRLKRSKISLVKVH